MGYGAAAGASVLSSGLLSCGGREPLLPDGGTPETPPADSGPGGGSPPNIVYVFVDQHRGDAFGAAGNPVSTTPNHLL